MTPETSRRFIDGWHIAYRECIYVKEPECARRVYRMYAQSPAASGGKTFLGVAFHSEKYKKLVADKVFARSDDIQSIGI